MSSDGTVNSQITDAATQSSTYLIGQGPATSMGMLDMVLLESLGTAMHNAVMRQQQNQMASSAAITAACAKMLQVPFPIRPPNSPLTPLIPADGLPGPVDPASDIANNYAAAQAAIAALKRDQSAATQNADTATQDLDSLIKQAGGTVPPASSTP